jgi:microcystin-dependent protein
MSEPFIAEIRIMSFGYPPKGWAMCNGQLLPINQNQALFSLLGTTYGGDGRTNFALPNLQTRTPMHVGNGHTLGERGGEQTHTLSIQEIPAHLHTMNGTSNSTDPNGTNVPTDNLLATGPSEIYTAAASLTPMGPTMVGNAGGGQGHQNMQPFLALNFCIALQGIFPSRN